jgi:hypothetical protein
MRFYETQNNQVKMKFKLKTNEKFSFLFVKLN